MDNIDEQAKQTIENIENFERTWHIFKTIVFALGLIAVVLIQFYTYSRLLNNSNSNRQLICSISRQARINNAEIASDCK